MTRVETEAHPEAGETALRRHAASLAALALLGIHFASFPVDESPRRKRRLRPRAGPSPTTFGIASSKSGPSRRARSRSTA